jgi:hypothetical protein
MKVHGADAGVTQAASAALPQVDDDVALRARGAAGVAPADRADVSRLGGLLETLQDLSRSDPERYQRAVASLSSRLDEAASAQPRGGGELFQALARKLRQRGAAPPPAAARGPAAAGYAHASQPPAPSALEDLVEAALKESAA